MCACVSICNPVAQSFSKEWAREFFFLTYTKLPNSTIDPYVIKREQNQMLTTMLLAGSQTQKWPHVTKMEPKCMISLHFTKEEPNQNWLLHLSMNFMYSNT